MLRDWLRRMAAALGLKGGPARPPRRAGAPRVWAFERLEDRTVPAAGFLDPAFGTDGTVVFAVNPPSSNNLLDIAVQVDGKILAAGDTRDANGEYAVVTRFNADGSADANFGSGGSALVDFSTSAQFLTVAIQSDGKIVAAGNSVAGGALHLALARFNPDGTPDDAFAGGSKTLPVMGGGSDAAWDLVMQPDGKIVVVGLVDNDLGLVRLNADGTLDATFGAGGASPPPLAPPPGSPAWFCSQTERSLPRAS